MPLRQTSWDLRFIPAGAGNTITAWLFGRRTPVYPRWRGEHWLYPLLFAIKHGLSPLARGTHRIRSGGAGRDRFIPAGAGNTGRINSEKPRSAVYPRWRGEHWADKFREAEKRGLSPLARGTLWRKTLGYTSVRFIPAGAGNTWCATIHHLKNTVYPRWRGEHTLSLKMPRCSRGLSPLARGTRDKRRVSASCQRFIPAGAGNTYPLSR